MLPRNVNSQKVDLLARSPSSVSVFLENLPQNRQCCLTFWGIFSPMSSLFWTVVNIKINAFLCLSLSRSKPEVDREANDRVTPGPFVPHHALPACRSSSGGCLLVRHPPPTHTHSTPPAKHSLHAWKLGTPPSLVVPFTARSGCRCPSEIKARKTDPGADYRDKMAIRRREMLQIILLNLVAIN